MNISTVNIYIYIYIYGSGLWVCAPLPRPPRMGWVATPGSGLGPPPPPPRMGWVPTRQTHLPKPRPHSTGGVHSQNETSNRHPKSRHFRAKILQKSCQKNNTVSTMILCSFLSNRPSRRSSNFGHVLMIAWSIATAAIL